MRANELKTGSYFVGLAADFWQLMVRTRLREQSSGCRLTAILLPANSVTVECILPTRNHTQQAGLIKDLFATLAPDDPCQTGDPAGSMWIIGTLRHDQTVRVNAWTQARPTRQPQPSEDHTAR